MRKTDGYLFASNRLAGSESSIWHGEFDLRTSIKKVDDDFWKDPGRYGWRCYEHDRQHHHQ